MEIISQQDLKFYYDRIFPFDTLYRWLSYNSNGESQKFAQREFSFAAASTSSSEFYMRWQSFRNSHEMRSKILSMVTLPHKIDIGAVYSVPVSQKDVGGSKRFYPKEKEFFLDIDMDDYDDVRTCCKQKTVCKKCWKFLALAAQILETALREDFGFKNIVWVYSGRRGIHGWICDDSARKLPSEGRAVIVDYLSLITLRLQGSSSQAKRVKLHQNSPTKISRRAYEIALEYFPSILEEQNFFTRGHQALNNVNEIMNNCIPDIKNAYNDLIKFSWDGSPQMLWKILAIFVAVVMLDVRQITQVCLPRDKATPMEILLSLCYPRLDINVSKGMEHLLKSPFCLHKGTGAVCVPLENVETFDPETCLNIQSIYEKHSSSELMLLYMVTSAGENLLKPYIEFFESKLQQMLEDTVLVQAPHFKSMSQEEIENWESFGLKLENMKTVDFNLNW